MPSLRTFLAILGLTLGLLAPAEALTPGQKVVLFSGYAPAVYTDFTAINSTLPSSLYTYSGPSLRTITDATGMVTYAANQLQLDNTLQSAWDTNSGTTTQSSNNSIAPNGTNTMCLVTESTGTSNHSLYSMSIPTLVAGKKYIAFIYIKPGTRRYLAFGLGPNTSQFGIVIDTSTTTPTIVGSGANGSAGYITSGISNTAINGSYLAWVIGTAGSTVGYVVSQGSPSSTFQPSAPSDGSKTWSMWLASVSAITYETSLSQRPAGDQTITTSAAYYGPAFDIGALGVGAPASGLRDEAAATNLYLNSGVPATQTITVANATQYTGSILGTGTQAFTGAFTATLTGAANTLRQATQTSATTSLVATDTSLTSTAYPQVEAGSFATSRIITSASSASRSADTIGVTGLLASLAVTSPIIVERQSIATGAISRTLYAKNTFAFANGYWYRKLGAWPANTPTAYLNQIVAMQRPIINN
jgi:hypothetical protein